MAASGRSSPCRPPSARAKTDISCSSREAAGCGGVAKGHVTRVWEMKHVPVMFDTGCALPPVAASFQLARVPARIPQVKNSWPRVELLRSRSSCRISLNTSLPPWRQVFNLSVSRRGFHKLKTRGHGSNSFGRVLHAESASISPSPRGGTFLTCRMRPQAQQDAILVPRLKAQQPPCRTLISMSPFSSCSWPWP